MENASGDVDVLMGIPKTARWELARYEDLGSHAELVELSDIVVAVATLDDIIRSKEIADRPADREALPEL